MDDAREEGESDNTGTWKWDLQLDRQDSGSHRGPAVVEEDG